MITCIPIAIVCAMYRLPKRLVDAFSVARFEA